MPDIGEEIVGTWLRYIRKCTFVDYNVQIPEGSGEIDVIGLNLKERHAYICEVATHTQGLGYKDNAKVIPGKFDRAMEYASGTFEGIALTFMFWSPVVRRGKQMEAIREVRDEFKKKHGGMLDLVTNKRYLERIHDLRQYAGTLTRDAGHPVLMLYQVEERARNYAAILSK